MNEIKPIETRYKGYRFRSRLEARWAVFFDALDVKWEYEKEGFHLPAGDYLPDFWLPEWECWVEVKPKDGITDRAKKLATELCDATSFPVIVTDGLARNDFQGLFIFKGFKDCHIHNSRFGTMQTEYGELHRLAFTLDYVESSFSPEELRFYRFYMASRFNCFENDVGFPRVCETSFCFQSFKYADQTLPAIILENNQAVVYKQLTDSDFDALEARGAKYDNLVRCDFYHPIIHCDIENKYVELQDDYSYSHSLIGKALMQAKSARFEHGENG